MQLPVPSHLTLAPGETRTLGPWPVTGAVAGMAFGLEWDALVPAGMTVRLQLHAGGEVYEAVGNASADILPMRYGLRYRFTERFGDAAWAYIAATPKDADGWVHGVPLSRWSDVPGAYVQIVLEHLWGDESLGCTILRADATEVPPATRSHHNSVAFDAATSAEEDGGDGVLSLSHTATGSDRAAWAGGCNADGAAGTLSASVTYNGVAMVVIPKSVGVWNEIFNTSRVNCGYALAAPATGAQTVTQTLAGATLEHSFGVITMTGVDQVTPVGLAVTASGNDTTPTVTVGGTIAAGDMLIDCMLEESFGSSPTPGAGQTERWSEDPASFFGYPVRGSTQAGSDGGVMSWTIPSTNWNIGAVAFKEAASGPTPFTGSDTASGTEGPPALALSGPKETATGSDAGLCSATVTPIRETGTGTEGTPAIVLGTLRDTGTGTEAQSVVVVQTGSDTGTFSDDTTEIEISSGGESGSGSDNGSVSASAGPGESGAGSEGNSISATLVSSDSGTGTDAGVVVQTGTNPVDSDSGSGSDAAIIEALLASLDSGVGTDAAELVVTLVGAESGNGSDTGFLTDVAWWVSDSGTGADASTLTGPTTYTGLAQGRTRIRPRLTGDGDAG